MKFIPPNVYAWWFWWITHLHHLCSVQSNHPELVPNVVLCVSNQFFIIPGMLGHCSFWLPMLLYLHLQNWTKLNNKTLASFVPQSGLFCTFIFDKHVLIKNAHSFLYVHCGSFFAAALSKCRHATQGAGTYILQGYTFLLLCILWYGGRKLKF